MSFNIDSDNDDTNRFFEWNVNGNSGSGTELMRLTDDGNLGIGDQDPQDYLEINGSGKGLGGLTISNSTHNHAALSFARSSTATARIYASEPNATHTSQLNFQTSDASGSSPNLVTAMVIADDQNVGIGNTNPAATLEVGTLTSGSTGNVIINSEGGNPPALQVKSRTNRARINIQDNDTSGYIIAEGSVISIGFADQISDNNININNSHNVGIGTSSPAAGIKLHVNGAVRVDNNEGVATRKIRSGYFSSGQNLTLASGSSANIIMDTQKVGIGNSNPQASLQVEVLGIETNQSSVTSTNQFECEAMSATVFRSARYTVQVTNVTDSTYQITEILLIHDGTTPSITEYGTIYTGSAAEASFDAEIANGNVRLLATPASSDNMQFKVVRHSILV